MNNSEKRRMELLQQTRNLYSDKSYLPAVHPRYRGIYRFTYSDDREQYSTFFIRLMIAVFLLVIFISADTKKISLPGLDSDEITHSIQTEINYAELWNNL